VVTKKSRVPSSSNPNFLQRFFLAVRVPLNSKFAPTVRMVVKDHRLGGLMPVVVGIGNISLLNKVWRDSWRVSMPVCVLRDRDGSECVVVAGALVPLLRASMLPTYSPRQPVR
jgi:hypothetical protein